MAAPEGHVRIWLDTGHHFDYKLKEDERAYSEAWNAIEFGFQDTGTKTIYPSHRIKKVEY